MRASIRKKALFGQSLERRESPSSAFYTKYNIIAMLRKWSSPAYRFFEIFAPNRQSVRVSRFYAQFPLLQAAPIRIGRRAARVLAAHQFYKLAEGSAARRMGS